MYAAPQQFDQRFRELLEEVACLQDRLDEAQGERTEQSDEPSC